MNIAALSARLMDLPDEALISEMKKPSGSAPQFLVMSELQRRQKIRSSARSQPAPSTTVADDLVAAAQPRPDTTGMASGMRGPMRGMARGGPVEAFQMSDRFMGGNSGGIARLGGYVPSAGVGRFTGNSQPPSDFSLAPWQADPNTSAFNFPLPQDAPRMMAAAEAPRGQGLARSDDTGAPSASSRSSSSLRMSSKGRGGVADLSGDEASTSGNQKPGTDFDEWMGNIKKVNDSGIFANPEMEQIRGSLAQRRAEMAGITKNAPWAALAKAGFKMAGGTSPFFATNAEALNTVADDVQQAKVDDLKAQLMMDGMAAKVAEAEATRRIKSADMATTLMNRQDQIEQRREASRDRSLDRRAQMEQTAMYRESMMAQKGEARAARQDAKSDRAEERAYSNLTSQLNTAMRLADAWDAKNGVLNPEKTNPHLATIEKLTRTMDGYVSKTFGLPSIQPNAAKPRVVDFNSLKR